jgi:hypothetical protein
MLRPDDSIEKRRSALIQIVDDLAARSAWPCDSPLPPGSGSCKVPSI